MFFFTLGTIRARLSKNYIRFSFVRAHNLYNACLFTCNIFVVSSRFEYFLLWGAIVKRAAATYLLFFFGSWLLFLRFIFIDNYFF